MKNFTLLFLFLFAPTATGLAQDYAVDAGSILLGGGVSFTSQGGDLYTFGDSRANTLTFNPTTQYFVLPGIAAGGDVVLLRRSQGNVSTTSLSIGPVLSYYLGGPESNAYPFVSGSVLYTNSSVDFGDENIDSLSGLTYGVSGGLTLMLTPGVGIMGEVFYLIDRLNADEEGASGSGNTFGLQVGIAAFIF